MLLIFFLVYCLLGNGFHGSDAYVCFHEYPVVIIKMMIHEHLFFYMAMEKV